MPERSKNCLAELDALVTTPQQVFNRTLDDLNRIAGRAIGARNERIQRHENGHAEPGDATGEIVIFGQRISLADQKKFFLNGNLDHPSIPTIALCDRLGLAPIGMDGSQLMSPAAISYVYRAERLAKAYTILINPNGKDESAVREAASDYFQALEDLNRPVPPRCTSSQLPLTELLKNCRVFANEILEIVHDFATTHPEILPTAPEVRDMLCIAAASSAIRRANDSDRDTRTQAKPLLNETFDRLVRETKNRIRMLETARDSLDNISGSHHLDQQWALRAIEKEIAARGEMAEHFTAFKTRVEEMIDKPAALRGGEALLGLLPTHGTSTARA